MHDRRNGMRNNEDGMGDPGVDTKTKKILSLCPCCVCPNVKSDQKEAGVGCADENKDGPWTDEYRW
jgi:hypothetical protein